MIKTVNGNYYPVAIVDGKLYAIKLCTQTEHILSSETLRKDVESLYNVVQSRMSQLDIMFTTTDYPGAYYEYFVGEHNSGNFQRAEMAMDIISSLPIPSGRDTLIGWYAHLYSIMAILDAVQVTYNNILESMKQYPDIFIRPAFGIPNPEISYVKHLHKYGENWV